MAAVEAVFEKKLTDTDVNFRLSFPKKNLGILPQGPNERAPVEFPVRCGAAGRDEYTFRCVKRTEGYLKPIIEYGWSALVEDYGVKEGDILKFYKGENNDGRPHYWIEVYRWVYYYDNMGTSKILRQIV